MDDDDEAPTGARAVPRVRGRERKRVVHRRHVRGRVDRGVADDAVRRRGEFVIGGYAVRSRYAGRRVLLGGAMRKLCHGDGGLRR